MLRSSLHRPEHSRLEPLRGIHVFAELSDEALAHLDAHMTDLRALDESARAASVVQLAL